MRAARCPGIGHARLRVRLDRGPWAPLAPSSSPFFFAELLRTFYKPAMVHSDPFSPLSITLLPCLSGAPGVPSVRPSDRPPGVRGAETELSPSLLLLTTQTPMALLLGVHVSYRDLICAGRARCPPQALPGQGRPSGGLPCGGRGLWRSGPCRCLQLPSGRIASDTRPLAWRWLRFCREGKQVTLLGGRSWMWVNASPAP